MSVARAPNSITGGQNPPCRKEELAMMYWSGDHMNGWGFGLMTVSMVLFWALVIFAVIALVRDMSRIGQSSQPNPVQPQLPPLQAPSPELLLSQRFACGEID